MLELNSKEDKEGNFEDWARVKRYKFFKEIYDKENCKCLFVGHQKDDLIETYLLQKKRNSIVEYYGLSKENIIQGMNVVRPLLNYTKKDLEIYCDENNIQYGIDETNFDLNYSRNKIRYEIIDKMTNEEKVKIIEEIFKKNLEKVKYVSYIKEKKQECLIDNKIDLTVFNKLSYEDKKGVIYYYLIDNLYKKISIKKSRIEDIIKKIDSNKPNIILANYDDITFYKEYNLLVIEENKKEYCYKIEDIKNIKISDDYYISDKGKKLERVIASKEQFPLYLRNYQGNDKKINRIFIDKKIPLRERKNWPIIVDKFGGLLLVIGIKKFYNELYDFKGNQIDFYVCKK